MNIPLLILGILSVYSLFAVLTEKNIWLPFPISWISQINFTIVNSVYFLFIFVPLHTLRLIFFSFPEPSSQFYKRYDKDISIPFSTLFPIIANRFPLIKIPSPICNFFSKICSTFRNYSILLYLFLFIKNIILGFIFLSIIYYLYDRIKIIIKSKKNTFCFGLLFILIFLYEWTHVKGPFSNGVQSILNKIQDLHLKILYFFIGHPSKYLNITEKVGYMEYSKRLINSLSDRGKKTMNSISNWYKTSGAQDKVNGWFHQTKEKVTNINTEEVKEAAAKIANKGKEAISKINAKEKATNLFNKGKEAFAKISEIDVKEAASNLYNKGKETLSKIPDIDVKEAASNLYNKGKETLSKIPDIDVKGTASNLYNKGKETLSKIPDIGAKEKLTDIYNKGKETLSKIPDIDAKEKIATFYNKGKETIVRFINNDGKEEEILVPVDRNVFVIIVEVFRVCVYQLIKEAKNVHPSPFHPYGKYVLISISWFITISLFLLIMKYTRILIIKIVHLVFPKTAHELESLYLYYCVMNESEKKYYKQRNKLLREINPIKQKSNYDKKMFSINPDFLKDPSIYNLTNYSDFHSPILCENEEMMKKQLQVIYNVSDDLQYVLGGAKSIEQYSIFLNKTLLNNPAFSSRKIIVGNEFTIRSPADLRFSRNTHPNSLFNLVKQKKIKIEFRKSNHKSIHNVKDEGNNIYFINLYLKNLTNKSIAIYYPNGSILDSNEQPCLVSEGFETTIDPKESYEVDLKWKCMIDKTNLPTEIFRLTPFVLLANDDEIEDYWNKINPDKSGNVSPTVEYYTYQQFEKNIEPYSNSKYFHYIDQSLELKLFFKNHRNHLVQSIIPVCCTNHIQFFYDKIDKYSSFGCKYWGIVLISDNFSPFLIQLKEPNEWIGFYVKNKNDNNNDFVDSDGNVYQADYEQFYSKKGIHLSNLENSILKNHGVEINPPSFHTRRYLLRQLKFETPNIVNPFHNEIFTVPANPFRKIIYIEEIESEDIKPERRNPDNF